jgi:hypothetical protein
MPVSFQVGDWEAMTIVDEALEFNPVQKIAMGNSGRTAFVRGV